MLPSPISKLLSIQIFDYFKALLVVVLHFKNFFFLNDRYLKTVDHLCKKTQQLAISLGNELRQLSIAYYIFSNRMSSKSHKFNSTSPAN